MLWNKNIPVDISEMFNSNLSFSISLLHVCFQKMFIVLDSVMPEINRNYFYIIQTEKWDKGVT